MTQKKTTRNTASKKTATPATEATDVSTQDQEATQAATTNEPAVTEEKKEAAPATESKPAAAAEPQETQSSGSVEFDDTGMIIIVDAWDLDKKVLVETLNKYAKDMAYNMSQSEVEGGARQDGFSRVLNRQVFSAPPEQFTDHLETTLAWAKHHSGPRGVFSDQLRLRFLPSMRSGPRERMLFEDLTTLLHMTADMGKVKVKEVISVNKILSNITSERARANIAEYWNVDQ